MDERAALRIVESLVGAAGDDAAIIDGQAVSVDMLHETSDFPEGVTPYTAGWRAISVSLSDLAAVGAQPTVTLGVYSPPQFERSALEAFINGAIDASTRVGAEYVGGDLDITDELTTVGIAIGKVDQPVGRSGANEGDAIVVTGTLGRGAIAVRKFEAGAVEEGNELFRFTPRIEPGRYLASEATAMIDSSDGLARSLHLLAEASDCGFEIEEAAIPIDPQLEEIVSDAEERRSLGIFWGEDFELIATLPPDTVDDMRSSIDIPLHQIGTVTEDGLKLDDASLPDRGFSHR